MDRTGGKTGFQKAAYFWSLNKVQVKHLKQCLVYRKASVNTYYYCVVTAAAVVAVHTLAEVICSIPENRSSLGH